MTKQECLESLREVFHYLRNNSEYGTESFTIHLENDVEEDQLYIWYEEV